MSHAQNNPSDFVYLNPYAPPGAAIEPYEPRLDLSKAHPRITFFSNKFTDASEFLADLEEPLHKLMPNATFTLYDKVHRANSSYPATPERIAEIARQSDALITAFGHCGSCTNGTVRDAVNFARAGLPVVALVTEKFMVEALFVSRALGMPDVPFIFLPHPVAGSDLHFQQALARAICPAILAALTEGKTTRAMDILGEQPANTRVA
ncbi:MAG: UGSC family (seleno)protein [Porticoccaceae bacterium]